MAKKMEVHHVIETRVERSEGLLKSMGISTEAYLRIALNALIANPDIGKCTPDSVDLALVKALNAGLMPDGKQGAILPFGSTATFIPMIEGRLMLARNAIQGLAVWAKTVYEGDTWEHEEGLRPNIVHRPDPTGPRDAKSVIAVYAVARVPGQDVPEFEVMYRGDIDRYRALSRARKGPWEGHYGEMGEKAALGLVLKRLPKKAAQALLDSDGDVFDGEAVLVQPDEALPPELRPAPAPEPERKTPPKQRKRQQDKADPEPAPVAQDDRKTAEPDGRDDQGVKDWVAGYESATHAAEDDDDVFG